jgi:hypothetical protein
MLSVILATLTGASATVGYCNDKDPSCATWARDGECDGDNGGHVKSICPHSCSVCPVICADRDDSCSAWAKQGECKSSPDYMLKECPTSCGICAPKCADVHTDCNHWAKVTHVPHPPSPLHPYIDSHKSSRRIRTETHRFNRTGIAKRTPLS